jgi:protein O-GlcNAc transferase
MSSNPRPADSVSRALALWRSGREQEARMMCEALATGSDDADAVSLLAEIYSAARRSADAVSTLRRLVQLRPSDASVHRRLGNTLLGSGAFSEAVVSYRESLTIESGNVRAHNNLGQALMCLRNFSEAATSYGQAIALDPRYAIAHNNLGIALYEQGEYELSVASYRRASELDPTFAEAHYNCGNALLKLNQSTAALASYERALSLKPASPETLLGRGNALQQLERYQEAVESYERVLQLDPNHVDSLNNAASALLVLKRAEEALRLSERAIAIKPDLAEAHSNRGGALRKLHRYEEAAVACERALELKPDYAQALGNLGNALLALERPGEALEYCERAIALNPDLPEAHDNRGGALMALKRTEEAAEAYVRLREISPDYELAAGALVHARTLCCDWREEAAGRDWLIKGVREGRPVAHPFVFVTISDSPALHLECARMYVARELPSVPQPLWRGERYKHDRIRVAYLSADFHDHATAVLMAGLFEAHDRRGFEIIGVSYGPEDASAIRRRLEQGFDRFVEVRNSRDEEVAGLLRSMEIDIAVDLKGYTQNSRPRILARRPAPIQVSYLGFPGTLGLDQIDYILADPIVVPPEHYAHYSEAVVSLPDTYQVNDSKRLIDEHTPTRAEVGLPPSGFVFCCFNHNYKITSTVFAIWMRLLQEVPGSVLWLLEDNAAAARNLRREVIQHGVDPARLVLAPRIANGAHLARHQLADLFLDTLPYNAHTTTSDALWAGVPVLTCLGNAFPGRVAASLLHAVGLPDLVTQNLDEYAGKALELARDPARIAELRARLSKNRSTRPLFDTARFCRHLEVSYTTMWQRYQDGLSPQSFAVPSLPVTEP